MKLKVMRGNAPERKKPARFFSRMLGAVGVKGFSEKADELIHKAEVELKLGNLDKALEISGNAISGCILEEVEAAAKNDERRRASALYHMGLALRARSKAYMRKADESYFVDLAKSVSCMLSAADKFFQLKNIETASTCFHKAGEFCEVIASRYKEKLAQGKNSFNDEVMLAAHEGLASAYSQLANSLRGFLRLYEARESEPIPDKKGHLQMKASVCQSIIEAHSKQLKELFRMANICRRSEMPFEANNTEFQIHEIKKKKEGIRRERDRILAELAPLQSSPNVVSMEELSRRARKNPPNGKPTNRNPSS